MLVPDQDQDRVAFYQKADDQASDNVKYDVRFKKKRYMIFLNMLKNLSATIQNAVITILPIFRILNPASFCADVCSPILSETAIKFPFLKGKA